MRCFDANDPLFELLNEEQKEQIREIVFIKLKNSVEKVNYDTYARKFADRVIHDMNDSIKRCNIYETDLEDFKNIVIDLMKQEFKKFNVSYNG